MIKLITSVSGFFGVCIGMIEFIENFNHPKLQVILEHLPNLMPIAAIIVALIGYHGFERWKIQNRKIDESKMATDILYSMFELINYLKNDGSSNYRNTYILMYNPNIWSTREEFNESERIRQQEESIKYTNNKWHNTSFKKIYRSFIDSKIKAKILFDNYKYEQFMKIWNKILVIKTEMKVTQEYIATDNNHDINDANKAYPLKHPILDDCEIKLNELLLSKIKYYE